MAGVLSAYGMGLADVTAMREFSVERRTRRRPAPETGRRHSTGRAARSRGADRPGHRAESHHLQRKLQVKYAGTDTTMLVDHGSRQSIARRFRTRHIAEVRFHDGSSRALIIEAGIVEAIGAQPATSE
jgi:5-oxoprolinase (ATP-hydrolysing)